MTQDIQDIEPEPVVPVVEMKLLEPDVIKWKDHEMVEMNKKIDMKKLIHKLIEISPVLFYIVWGIVYLICYAIAALLTYWAGKNLYEIFIE